MNFEILARELQRLIEARNSAIIINPAPDLTEQVIIGSIVTILNEKTGKKQKVKITGNVE
jgi:transcription elongation GreA/GreB family factor